MIDLIIFAFTKFSIQAVLWAIRTHFYTQKQNSFKHH